MTHVVIAGAGPTGLMLACELALAGIDTTVVERASEPRAASPGMAINAAVVELLGYRGLMPLLADDGLSWSQAHFSQLWLDPSGLTEPHANSFVVPQAVLEQRLTEHAVKLGVEIRYGHEVVDIAQDESGVEVRLGQATITAEYLVGCDGSGSTVRELAKIGFPGAEAPFYGLVGDLAADSSHPLFQWLGSRDLSGSLFTVAPSGPETLRVATGEFGVESPDRNSPVTAEEFAGRIHAVTGANLPVTGVRWLSRWHNATRLADRYRAGRVFLAGEAAHVHFPFGGQAMSTCIEDAVNLGWKLAAVIHGRVSDELLDTYERERRPVGERACETTRAQVAMLHPIEQVAPLRKLFTELIAFPDVNRHLVTIAGGLGVHYALGAEPPVGCRLPELELRTPTGPVTVAELLHAGRGVLLSFAGDLAAADAVADWADRVDPHVAEPVLAGQALLLRPDGYVAWAGELSDPALRTALTTWFGAPAV